MKHLLVLAVLLAVFIPLFEHFTYPWPYSSDEADYMFAVSRGARANAFDTPTQSLPDFIRAGLNRGRSIRRADLSEYIRASGDIAFYRHWHGPLYFYWLAAIAPLRLNEQAVRGLNAVFPALTVLAVYLGCLWLAPGREGFLAAILGSTLYLWSNSAVRTSEICPHPLFALCSVAALILLMKWRATNQPWHWYGAVVACSLAFCTMELAFVPVLAMLICAALARRLTDWRWMGKSMLLFVAVDLTAWPAGLLKLTFVKAYMIMAYLALFRKSPWGNVTFAEAWRLRLTESPWEWLLLAIAVALYFLRLDGGRRRVLLPALLYGALMLAAILRVNTNAPRYLLPLLPAMHLFTGLTLAAVLGAWRPGLRALGAGVVCALTLCYTASQLSAHPLHPGPRPNAVLVRVRELTAHGERILAPQDDLMALHYYFPNTFVRGYADDAERSELLAGEHFDYLLEPGEPVRIERVEGGHPQK